MRFAISLLVYICLASLVGTVVPQGRTPNAYIDQFGPFWFEVLDKFSWLSQQPCAWCATHQKC